MQQKSDFINRGDDTMSKLYYKINLEEFFDSDDDYRVYHNHLPHFQQLKDWLPKEWAEYHIEQTFSMKEIRENIESCILTVRQGKNGETYAIVTINFKPGFRLSARRRESVWDDLDAQMSDGFGESVDHNQIPGAPDGYMLYL